MDEQKLASQSLPARAEFRRHPKVAQFLSLDNGSPRSTVNPLSMLYSMLKETRSTELDDQSATSASLYREDFVRHVTPGKKGVPYDIMRKIDGLPIGIVHT